MSWSYCLAFTEPAACCGEVLLACRQSQQLSPAAAPKAEYLQLRPLILCTC